MVAPRHKLLTSSICLLFILDIKTVWLVFLIYGNGFITTLLFSCFVSIQEKNVCMNDWQNPENSLIITWCIEINECTQTIIVIQRKLAKNGAFIKWSVYTCTCKLHKLWLTGSDYLRLRHASNPITVNSHNRLIHDLRNRLHVSLSSSNAEYRGRNNTRSAFVYLPALLQILEQVVSAITRREQDW